VKARGLSTNRNGEVDALESTYVGEHLARAGLIRTRTPDVRFSIDTGARGRFTPLNLIKCRP
jgi:hypothetical protein